MQFTYDNYKRLKYSKLILANPQKNKIDLISGVKELKVKIYFNSISEMSFKIYEYEDGRRNKLYDKLEEMRLVEMQYIAWFQIQNIDETHSKDNITGFKVISCLSLENDLIDKTIDAIDGVYGLYDITDTEHSLMHIIPKYCGWNLGHIDATLTNKFRTFSVDSDHIYNFLMTTVTKSFNCVIQYDTYNKLINFYELENLGKLTNITISNKNILQEYTRKSDKDNIATVLKVRGGTNSDNSILDIRSINPDGSDTIFNIDYYKTLDWMSSGLIQSLNNYESDYTTLATQYSSALETYKQYQIDFNTLNNQLVEIESQITIQNNIMGVSVKNHYGNPPIESDSDYTIYQAAVSQLAVLNTQKYTKDNEIASKNLQITNQETILNNINNSLNKSNYFTSDQLKELETFMKRGSDYSDETFQVVSTMTNEEIINMKLELKSNAEKELLKVCRPQFTIDTTISNLWSIQDGLNNKISFQKWKEDLICGNMITLKFRDDYKLTVRLMIMEFDFDDLENVKLTFSDKSKLDDKLTQLGEILAQSTRTSNALTLNAYGYDAAAKNTSSFIDFKTGMLNATLNKMVSDDKAQVETDEFGLHIRQWDTNTNTYSPYQMWLNPFRMLFTDDGWVTANSAFGRLISPSGEEVMGINTDVIIGNMVLTSKLNISNENNTITMDKDGATFNNCDINIVKGTNLIKLNASDGIQIFNGINKQFYVDVDGNVTFGGNLNAATGTFSGQITGGSININNNFNVNSMGNLTCTGANINGNITSVGLNYTTTINNGTITTGQLYSSSGNLTTQLTAGNLVLSDGSGSATLSHAGLVIPTGFVSVGGSISIGGNTALHVGNLVNQCNSNSLVVPFASVAYSVYGLQTSQITAVNTGYGNLNFQGFDNAAGVNWVQANFEPKTSSDVRLKYDIQSLDNIPDDLFYSLKPKQFKYKTETLIDGIAFGLIAQQVENLFVEYGLNPYDYNLVEVKDVRKYTDDGYFVDDATHRLNYNNLIAWMIKILQNQNFRIIQLENKF